ncbi:MAG: ABC transporter permease subunit [Deltaproteobacteria bacterium]|nr:ABC transporter permease subunit [Deltaproteobacteria bacterium]
MSWVLLKKELRVQRPFVLLLALLIGFGVVDGLVLAYPDELTAWAILGDLDEAGSEAASMVTFFVAFAMGSGLLWREREERTLEFLDGLPVSRGQIFASKLVAAMVVLAVMPLGDGLMAVARAASSTHSLRPTIPWGLIASGMALRLAMIWVVLCLAVALSFLGRFAWIGLSTCFFSFNLLLRFEPAATLFDPLQLTAPKFRYGRWDWPTSALAWQLSLSLALVVLSAFLFARAGDRLWRHSHNPASPRASFWLATASVLIGIAAMAYVGFGDSKRPTVSYAEVPTQVGETLHYQMKYPSTLGGRAERVLAGAEGVHRQVMSTLAFTDSTTITVNAGRSRGGTAGTAMGNTIIVDLSTSTRTETLLAVLGHETVHVYAERLAKGRNRGNTFAGLFNEGLATWVEFERFRGPIHRAQSRLFSAAMWDRRDVVLSDLLGVGDIGVKVDHGVIYPLGELFIDALIRRHGRSAPGKILAALGRDDAPTDLEPMEAWREAFHHAGFDLDGVAAEFTRDLEGRRRNERKALQSLPRLFTEVSERDGTYLVAVVPSEPQDYWVQCRFRATSDTPPSEYTTVDLLNADTCTIRWTRLPGRSFWYQVGIVDLRTRQALWDPWVEVNVD